MFLVRRSSQLALLSSPDAYEKLLHEWKELCRGIQLTLDKRVDSEFKKRTNASRSGKDKAKLNLANTKLNDAQVTLLLDCLANMPCIAKLDIGNNATSIQTVDAVLKCLQNQVLKAKLEANANHTYLTDIRLKCSNNQSETLMLNEIDALTAVLKGHNLKCSLRRATAAYGEQSLYTTYEVECILKSVLRTERSGALSRVMAGRNQVSYEDLERVIMSELVDSQNVKREALRRTQSTHFNRSRDSISSVGDIAVEFRDYVKEALMGETASQSSEGNPEATTKQTRILQTKSSCKNETYEMYISQNGTSNEDSTYSEQCSLNLKSVTLPHTIKSVDTIESLFTYSVESFLENKLELNRLEFKHGISSKNFLQSDEINMEKAFQEIESYNSKSVSFDLGGSLSQIASIDENRTAEVKTIRENERARKWHHNTSTACSEKSLETAVSAKSLSCLSDHTSYTSSHVYESEPAASLTASKSTSGTHQRRRRSVRSINSSVYELEEASQCSSDWELEENDELQSTDIFDDVSTKNSCDLFDFKNESSSTRAGLSADQLPALTSDKSLFTFLGVEEDPIEVSVGPNGTYENHSYESCSVVESAPHNSENNFATINAPSNLYTPSATAILQFRTASETNLVKDIQLLSTSAVVPLSDSECDDNSDVDDYDDDDDNGEDDVDVDVDYDSTVAALGVINYPEVICGGATCSCSKTLVAGPGISLTPVTGSGVCLTPAAPDSENSITPAVGPHASVIPAEGTVVLIPPQPSVLITTTPGSDISTTQTFKCLNLKIDTDNIAVTDVSPTRSISSKMSKMKVSFSGMALLQLDLLQKMTIRTLSKLRSLSLAGNKISSLSELKLRLLTPNLQSLDVSYNLLMGVFEKSILPSSLLKLNVTGNALSNIEALLGCPELLCLRASKNKLTSISALPSKLMLLDLRDNLITGTVCVRSLIAFCKQLTNLSLSGNPVCNLKDAVNLRIASHLPNLIFLDGVQVRNRTKMSVDVNSFESDDDKYQSLSPPVTCHNAANQSNQHAKDKSRADANRTKLLKRLDLQRDSNKMIEEKFRRTCRPTISCVEAGKLAARLSVTTNYSSREEFSATSTYPNPKLSRQRSFSSPSLVTSSGACTNHCRLSYSSRSGTRSTSPTTKSNNSPSRQSCFARPSSTSTSPVTKVRTDASPSRHSSSSQSTLKLSYFSPNSDVKVSQKGSIRTTNVVSQFQTERPTRQPQTQSATSIKVLSFKAFSTSRITIAEPLNLSTASPVIAETEQESNVTTLLSVPQPINVESPRHTHSTSR